MFLEVIKNQVIVSVVNWSPSRLVNKEPLKYIFRPIKARKIVKRSPHAYNNVNLRSDRIIGILIVRVSIIRIKASTGIHVI